MRWFLVVLVLAAAGGVGWLFLADAPCESDADAGMDREVPPDEAAPRAVTLEGAEGAGPRSLRATVGRCSIKARVTRDGKPAVARVEARFLISIAALSSGAWALRWQKDQFTPPAPLGPAAAAAVSDAEGNALLAGVAAGLYRLSARSDDGAQAETNVSVPADGVTILAVLELREGGQTLEGKITWSDGTGVAGVLVFTPPMSRGSTQQGVPATFGLPSTTLAADGSFTLGGLATGSHAVRLIAGDTLAVNLPAAVLPATKPYLVTLEPLTKRVTGRVLDAVSDAPIQGATVVASSSLGSNTWGSTRAMSDGDGRFETMAGRLPAWLYASAPGYGTNQRNVQATGTDPVTLRLVRTGRIAGRVTAKDGSAAAGAVVCASCGTNNSNMRVSATADKEGHYALEEVYAGEAILVVRGGGWTSPDLGDVRTDGFNPFVVAVAGGASLTVDLVAIASARLEGKTVDATGAPVAGASVGTSALMLGHGQVVWRLQSALGQENTASDANGAFTLENLVPGMSYSLQAQAPDQPQANAGPFVVSAEPSPPVEVRFPVARWVDVRVLYEGEEAGVADARVTILQVQGPGNQSQLPGTWTTDREGRVRAGPIGPSPQGDLGVQVTGEMLAPNKQPVVIEGSKEAPGPFTTTVRVPRGRTIEGKVLKPDGTPASGAWVNAHLKDPPQGHSGGASTSADGSFTLKSLGAGTYNLNAGLQQPDAKLSWNGTGQAEAGATGVTLTLAESPAAQAREAIVVKVLDDRGELVRQVQVRLYNEQGSSSNSGTQDGTARFEFGKGNNDWIPQGLAKGILYVEVWNARNSADLPVAAGPARVGPLGAEQRDVEVRLPPERTIEGRVVADDGAAVRGVLVRARPTPDPALKNSQAQSVGEGRSDAQGRFRIGSLGEGEHKIEVSTPPDYLVPDVAPVAAGTRGLEVVLKRGLSARVRVRDAEGQPLARAWVNPQPQMAPNLSQAQQGEWHRRRNLLQSQGRSDTASTAHDGVAVLRGLDPEMSYSLTVGAPKEDLRATTLPRWTPADTEVQLERGYVVSGTVRDAQGRLVPGAQVFQKQGTGGWGGIGVNQDGTFRLTGLARGMITLAATAPGVQVNWQDANLPSITVAVGTENVTLVVEPGIELVVRVPNAAERGPNGQHVSGQILVRRGEKWEQRGWANDGEGRLVFKGLRADETYAVWVQPAPGSDLFGWATDLRPGAGDAVIRLERGGMIRGRVTLPAGAADLGIGASGEHGGWVLGTLDTDGRYEIRGLPDMKWKVYAWANVQQRHWNAQADAAVGGTLDLRLEQQPEGR